jgi:hypothetical protein
MAVEIKELVIRAVVDYPSSSGHKVPEAADRHVQPDPTELVNICVEQSVKQVLKILKQQQKR